jgi:hypothetical protein
MSKHFDTGTISVIIITFVLFAMALFTKGFTHDLLLEAAVFLISVKLILMIFHNRQDVASVKAELHEIKEMIRSGNRPG